MKDYRDSLFRFLFGNEETKEWTLSLYNAIHDTNLTDKNLINFVDIGDAFFSKYRNDLSFICLNDLEMYEHQSTWNPNMPLRFLLYYLMAMEHLYDRNSKIIYSSTAMKVLTPHFIVLYNGEKPLKSNELKFSGLCASNDSSLEVKVRCIDINHGDGEILQKCQCLYEYVYVTERMKTIMKKGQDEETLRRLIGNLLKNLPESFIIKSRLLKYEKEVTGMILDPYNEELHLQVVAEEAMEKGKAIGADKVRKDMVKRLLSLNYSVHEIVKIMGLQSKDISQIS